MLEAKPTRKSSKSSKLVPNDRPVLLDLYPEFLNLSVSIASIEPKTALPEFLKCGFLILKIPFNIYFSAYCGSFTRVKR